MKLTKDELLSYGLGHITLLELMIGLSVLGLLLAGLCVYFLG